MWLPSEGQEVGCEVQRAARGGASLVRLPVSHFLGQASGSCPGRERERERGGGPAREGGRQAGGEGTLSSSPSLPPFPSPATLGEAGRGRLSHARPLRSLGLLLLLLSSTRWRGSGAPVAAAAAAAAATDTPTGKLGRGWPRRLPLDTLGRLAGDRDWESLPSVSLLPPLSHSPGWDLPGRARFGCSLVRRFVLLPDSSGGRKRKRRLRKAPPSLHPGISKNLTLFCASPKPDTFFFSKIGYFFTSLQNLLLFCQNLLLFYASPKLATFLPKSANFFAHLQTLPLFLPKSATFLRISKICYFFVKT